MAEHSHGMRKTTRSKLKKGVRDKFTPEAYLKSFKKGQKVVLSHDPASQKGLPHPRFKGKVGEVVGSRGTAYVIAIKDGNKPKTLIVKPEHLKAA